MSTKTGQLSRKQSFIGDRAVTVKMERAATKTRSATEMERGTVHLNHLKQLKQLLCEQIDLCVDMGVFRYKKTIF